MKRFFAILSALVLGCAFAVSLAACGESSGGSGSTTPDTSTTPGGTTPGGTTPGGTTGAATPSQVVSAIQSFAEEDEQNYDFTLNLAGNVSVGPVHSPNANATYECNYRYNAATGDLAFKRVTSGVLLYDSIEYIYSSGSSRVTVKMNGDNEVKKTVVDYKDDELKLINRPFTALLNSLPSNGIADITGSNGRYTSHLNLSSDNSVLNTICNILGKLDTSINLKGVTFTNPVSGIVFDFAMAGGVVSEFTLKAGISVPVSAASVNLDLTYSQRMNSAPVRIPNIDGLMTSNSEIAAELGVINAALEGVGDSEAYSLDFEAVNEMDPAWNVIATKDSYKGRLYRNADGFNHSYEYHSHHEEDGRETYKYTIGNTTRDGKTYLRSRKGSDTVTELENVTADTQFDLLTRHFIHTASDVDCLKKVTKDETTTYTIYLKDSIVAQMSEEIVAFLNTNEADGVVDIENYFNENDYTIKDATLTVVMEGDAVVSMELDTEIKYNPTAGEYTENNVSLKNQLVLKVNDRLDKAQKYEVPKKPDGFGGLDYIL